MIDYVDKAEKMLEWMRRRRLDGKIFWLRDYCIDFGVTDEEVEGWAKESEVYAKALKIFKMGQEAALCDEGLRKGSNQQFIKMALVNLCGWKDERVARFGGAERAKEEKSYLRLMKEVDGEDKANKLLPAASG